MRSKRIGVCRGRLGRDNANGVAAVRGARRGKAAGSPGTMHTGRRGKFTRDFEVEARPPRRRDAAQNFINALRNGRDKFGRRFSEDLAACNAADFGQAFAGHQNFEVWIEKNEDRGSANEEGRVIDAIEPFSPLAITKGKYAI